MPSVGVVHGSRQFHVEGHDRAAGSLHDQVDFMVAVAGPQMAHPGAGRLCAAAHSERDERFEQWTNDGRSAARCRSAGASAKRISVQIQQPSGQCRVHHRRARFRASIEPFVSVPGQLRNRPGTFIRVDAVLHALSDASRRTVLEALGQAEATAGELAALLPIARPGVSRHLRVLREAGLVQARSEAQRRVYSLRPEPLAEVQDWLGHCRSLWEQRLDALHTEVSRGKKQRRSTS